MTTSADDLLAAMQGASAQALRELERIARGIDIDDAAAVQRFANVWFRMIEEYGNSLRQMAGDRYRTIRSRHISRPYKPVYGNTSITSDYALKRLKDAFYTHPKDPRKKPERLKSFEQAMPTIRQLTDELVRQPARNVIVENAYQDVRCRGYIRVLVGDSCAFCVMLAARGSLESLSTPGAPGLYKSRWSAGDGYGGNTYHANCDCMVEPVFDIEKDLERISQEYGGYNADQYYQMYLTSRSNAGSGSTEEILAQMRKDHNLT